jgi:hypothetical protein
LTEGVVQLLRDVDGRPDGHAFIMSYVT